MYSYTADITPVENGETVNGLILRGAGRLLVGNFMWVKAIVILEKADAPDEYVVLLPNKITPESKDAEEAIKRAVVMAYKAALKAVRDKYIQED